jgi:hypothetical protein
VMTLFNNLSNLFFKVKHLVKSDVIFPRLQLLCFQTSTSLFNKKSKFFFFFQKSIH